MASPTKKRVRLVSAEVLADRPESENIAPIDWSRCCLCQRAVQSLGALKCPAANLSKDTRLAGYKQMAEMLAAFNNIGRLPASVPFAALAEGGKTVQETLINRSAKWHKGCELKVNRKELSRVQERQKKLEALTTPPPRSPVKRHLTRSGAPALSVMPLEEKCFVCGEKGTWSRGLCKVSTAEVEQKIAEVAEKTSNLDLKAQLAALFADGPLRAQESRYHVGCLSNLYRTVKHDETATPTETREKQSLRACEAIAFADVVSAIVGEVGEKGSNCIFPMSVICKSYQRRLAHIVGAAIESLPAVHSTRLREKIVESCPFLRLERPAHEYVFVQGGFAPVLVTELELGRDVIAFKRFVRELRTEMLDHPATFAGSLKREEQAAGTPATLSAVNMLLYGPSAADMDRATQPALSLTQLLQFNMLKRQPKGSQIRNVRTREPSLPVFLSLSTYARSRSKEAIAELHELGLGISATRVYEISSALCHLSVKRAEEEGFFCPADLRRGLFTIGALDNVDHNPTSSTSTGSFHGTGISIFQVPTRQCPGQPRLFETSYESLPQSTTDIPSLPDSYAVVPSAVLQTRQPAPSAAHPGTRDAMSTKGTVWVEREKEWLNYAREVVQGREHGLDLTWAAFHATNDPRDLDVLPIVNTLLPLFHEVAETPSMVKHGLNIVISITSMVNAGQTPVMCMDQPLYALGKILQWNWPETYGEHKIVLIMGGLHIEQAFLRLLGSFMEECGWAQIFAQAGVTSEVGAEGLLKVHHIKKSRASHEATAAALYTLLHDAHAELCDTNIPVTEWAEQQRESPTFIFWWTVLKLEMLLLGFVGALRSGCYDQYVSSIRDMLPLFFAWDKINYARWLSVHLKDLAELPLTAPDVASAFSKGFFSLPKTNDPFTRISPDQVHEQNNKIIKGQGGAIGLTEDRQSLLRWMLAGPEIQRLLDEFNPVKYTNSTEGLETRHDQYNSFQVSFKKQVHSLRSSFLERGNPFMETGPELINVHTRDVLGPDAVKALAQMESDGVAAFHTFVNERLTSNTRSVFDPIKKTNRKIFTSRTKNIQGKAVEIKSLQMDAQLFLRLYIMSEHRQLDLEVFFSFENQVCPPSVSKNGDLRLPENKSEILSLLVEGRAEPAAAPESRDCLIVDASILPHLFPPRTSNTFIDYWQKDLKPKLVRESVDLQKQRLDLAWDLYSPSSLKRT
ncbi:3-dehydroquinate synthase, partial [Frankliniella fusca]